MIEALKQALEALYPISHNSTDDYRGQADKAIISLRQAIVELENQEPVAWQERQAKRMKDGVVTEWSSWYPCLYRTIDEARTLVPDHIPYEWRPLYTHPPQRKPLTDEQIDALWVLTPDEWDDCNFVLYARITRIIEAAHGIKEES